MKSKKEAALETLRARARAAIAEAKLTSGEVVEGSDYLENSSNYAKIFVNSLIMAGGCTQEELIAAAESIGEFCIQKGMSHLMTVAAAACIFGAGCKQLSQGEEANAIAQAVAERTGVGNA